MGLIYVGTSCLPPPPCTCVFACSPYACMHACACSMTVCPPAPAMCIPACACRPGPAHAVRARGRTCRHTSCGDAWSEAPTQFASGGSSMLIRTTPACRTARDSHRCCMASTRFWASAAPHAWGVPILTRPAHRPASSLLFHHRRRSGSSPLRTRRERDHHRPAAWRLLDYRDPPYPWPCGETAKA